MIVFFFFFQAEDGIRDYKVTGVQTCALPISAQAAKLKSDTAALRAFRHAFADRIDSAKAYLAPALSSPDSTDRLSAAVFMLTGGSKLAQAGAYDRAHPWLHPPFPILPPRPPAATLRP